MYVEPFYVNLLSRKRKGGRWRFAGVAEVSCCSSRADNFCQRQTWKPSSIADELRISVVPLYSVIKRSEAHAFIYAGLYQSSVSHACYFIRSDFLNNHEWLPNATHVCKFHTRPNEAAVVFRGHCYLCWPNLFIFFLFRFPLRSIFPRTYIFGSPYLATHHQFQCSLLPYSLSTLIAKKNYNWVEWTKIQEPS